MKTFDPPNTIAVFYSRGPHYLRALRYLRANTPDADITAIVPPGYPREALSEVPDHCVETGRKTNSLIHPVALIRLCRMVRARRFELFVVLFPSLKLRLLAAASGARHTYCYGPDGRFLPLHFAPGKFMLDWIWRRILGHWTFLRIWCVVHFQRVK